MLGYMGGFNLADFCDFSDEWYFGTPVFSVFYQSVSVSD